MAKVNSIKVRMYRHGFGDCFLLRFYAGEKLEFTLLIDCGLKKNQVIKSVKIEDVIADLKNELTPEAGKHPKLDALVATHEHWDHVSAFDPKKKFFDDFEIEKIWLAWTENPKDSEAKSINSRLQKGVSALAIAVSELNRTREENTSQYSLNLFADKLKDSREAFSKGLKEVMDFYGNVSGLSLSKTSPDGIKYKTGGKLSIETQTALEHLISLSKKEKNSIQYFEPGAMVDKNLLPEGINIFVLGPPKNKLINSSDPSKGTDKEVYFGIDGNGSTGFVDGMLSMTDIAGTGGDDGRPFAKSEPVINKAEENPYYKEAYLGDNNKWRKIDNDWLDIAGQFALQLDGAINNTSLVLAIQFADSEKVLLFPGDAQVGSWMSWHDYTWSLKKDGKTKDVNAEYLLNNTVLYKVSHHGSYNATVKDKGLEMMTHAELVALIPEKEKSYNGILYDPLMQRLETMCKGRVVVSADKNYPADQIKEEKPAALSTKEWNEFKENLEVKDLYIEYIVYG